MLIVKSKSTGPVIEMSFAVLAKERRYVCPECDVLHADEDAARDCCWHRQYKTVEQYECPVCDKVWVDFDAAVQCCVEDVTVSVACPDCGEMYEGCDIDPVREAQRCCHRPGTVDRYRCKKCKEVYDTEADADNCCIDIEAIEAYECSQCGVMFASKFDAMKCCA
jgi:hypothetical protein